METNPNSSPEREAAIQWYEGQLRTADKTLRIAQTRPDWDKMIKHRFSDGTPVFVVPLATLDGSSLGLGTGGDTKEAKEKAVRVREHLMLFKTEDGVMHGWMMKIAPTFEYQQQTKGDFQNNTFEGKILVDDLEGKFVKGFVYENGRITRTLAEGNPANARTNDTYCRWVEVTWYTMACSPPHGCDVHYSHTDWKVDCPFTSSSGTYSGGGSGGGAGSKWFTDGSTPLNLDAREDLLNKITGLITLNPNQKKQLADALIDFFFLGRCMNEALYNQLLAMNKTFNFTIDPNIPHNVNAVYKPANGTMSFRSQGSIQGQYMQEELFHGYQDAYYPGGIQQYGDVGKSNIEFEAHLFKDLVAMMEFGNGIQGVPIGHPKHNDYHNWLRYELLNNFSSYPTQINLDKYFEYLEAFRESYGAPYNATPRQDLYPNALMNLLKSKSCN